MQTSLYCTLSHPGVKSKIYIHDTSIYKWRYCNSQNNVEYMIEFSDGILLIRIRYNCFPY